MTGVGREGKPCSKLCVFLSEGLDRVGLSWEIPVIAGDEAFDSGDVSRDSHTLMPYDIATTELASGLHLEGDAV